MFDDDLPAQRPGVFDPNAGKGGEDDGAIITPPDWMLNSLHETVCTSISREIRTTLRSSAQVICFCIKLPKRDDEYQYYSMNGTLFLTMVYGLILSFASTTRGLKDSVSGKNGTYMILSLGAVFVVGLFVGFNVSVLGGEAHPIAVMATAGYCLLPLVLFSLVVLVMAFLKRNVSATVTLIVVITVGIGCAVWSALGALRLVGTMVPKEKRFLAIYPLGLHFLGLSVIGMMSATGI
ncbi:Yip1 family member 6 [Giardia muris]|uniref:Protein YIPF n=1 Tax=Giardia muris TaxID=5742 RepID=A0A4Z1SV94_GIAMU|nr:Yip1 family member 6 [Giardia muris]|eukprot:TNJ28845.1 Yip1 family member 6 [Giardia muris]